MCECGAEILLLPDLKAMGRAIEVHVALHMKGAKSPVFSNAEASHLRDALIIQVLRISGEHENDGAHE